MTAAKKLTGFAVALAAIFGVSFGAGQLVGLFPLLKTASSDVHSETHNDDASDATLDHGEHDVHPTGAEPPPTVTETAKPTTQSNNPAAAEPTSGNEMSPATLPAAESENADAIPHAPVTTAFTVRAPQQGQ